jgi:hypothetical protein
MKIHAALLAASALILASAASAQTGSPILAPTTDWTVYSKVPHQSISDAKVEGGKAIEVKAPGTGGIWEVAGIRPIDGGIAKGDHVVASVWIKSDVPAKVVFRIETRGAAAFVGERHIDVGTDWSQQTLDFVAKDTYPAGTTQIALLLNSGKQTINLGPVSVVNKGGN